MHVRPLKVFTVASVIPEELSFLERLAYNFWWSWNRKAESLFALIDQERWERIRRNPVRLLKETSQERFRQLIADKNYRRLLEEVEQEFDAYLTSPPLVEWEYDGPIAYFCAEYGISECFQNYSGGLGVLAGDHLKTSSDMGIPLVGIGLLYQQGYFHQHVTYNGWQQENFLDYDFSLLPIMPVVVSGGEPLKVQVELPESDVVAQVWEAKVGRVPLYLLDTNIPDNAAHPTYANITDQLYGGTHETRIMQEMVLGIGGVRVLEALGIEPAVIHVNEGHAAFCTLERTRQLAKRYRLSFHEAAEITRAQTCFTTHTPVPAGNEIFSVGLLKKYFSRYVPTLDITWEEFVSLGQANNSSSDEGFSMTILGLRMSTYRNGVSQLHGQVARSMWHSLWHHVPAEEVPIIGITNGVHTLTWVSSDFASLFDKVLGSRWRLHPDDPTVWEAIVEVPDAEIWAVHSRRRQRLLEAVRMHLRIQQGYYDDEHRQRAIAALHPNCLIIGFARRFATYKRSDLLFRNWERLASILRNPSRPVVVLLAGKAHPQDYASKEMMQRILAGIRAMGLENHVIFLEDYDLGIARALVKGVDVWLNTPRRPYEASGTSGMKAALNGVLHCSVLDGWWVEAARSDNGFTIGGTESFASQDEQDLHESESLYQLLENDIIPMFYERDAAGIPRRWVQRMKMAIATLAAEYSSHRMVRQYLDGCYRHAAQLSRSLAERNGLAAKALSQWKTQLPKRWSTLQILALELPNTTYCHVGEPVIVRVVLECGELQPEELLVQVYHGPTSSRGEFISAQATNLSLVKVEGTRATFEGSYTVTESGQHGVTVRILPYHPYVPNPVDLKHVLWAQ
ncbi:MAG: alpha-glucan family phosphorylase [Bacteroidota bacterium]|nr:alpha-glucan family phosphorylase [Candidatus Kapabacteria bacterium]MDW8074300.1 alpha-glucan family phosphorylase [Bacteroidota bacterium]MDW8271224.1 alpha-glucan family phosphorylase [Bacteroidota bacterium]